MDKETKCNLTEGMPLNAESGPNIYLSSGRNSKLHSPNGTVLHLNPDKSNSPDVGLHINTTFSVGSKKTTFSSKKIKMLFVLNFILCTVCLMLTLVIAFYYWREIISMNSQLAIIKAEFLEATDEKAKNPKIYFKEQNENSSHRNQKNLEINNDQFENTESVTKNKSDNFLPTNVREFISNRAGYEEVQYKTDTNSQRDSTGVKTGLLVAHFIGSGGVLNMGSDTLVGPWVYDSEVSSADANSWITLSPDSKTIHVQDDGIYLIYSQVVYLTHSANSYFIFARNSNRGQDMPRLISACATGDDSSRRPLAEAQISCSVQTVARLRRGDALQLSLREHNMTLWLKAGYSYVGLIKLS